MHTTFNKYITYETAANILDIDPIEINYFVADTGFPTKGYRMIHDSFLNRYPGEKGTRSKRLKRQGK
jgi:hypothetical protein